MNSIQNETWPSNIIYDLISTDKFVYLIMYYTVHVRNTLLLLHDNMNILIQSVVAYNVRPIKTISCIFKARIARKNSQKPEQNLISKSRFTKITRCFDRRLLLFDENKYKIKQSNTFWRQEKPETPPRTWAKKHILKKEKKQRHEVSRK